MTNTQINSILKDLGYSTDMLIEMSEVTAIALDSNECIYPDKVGRLKFCSDKELLLVYDGYFNKKNEFVVFDKPASIVIYSEIHTFFLKNHIRQKAPYRYGFAI